MNEDNQVTNLSNNIPQGGIPNVQAPVNGITNYTTQVNNASGLAVNPNPVSPIVENVPIQQAFQQQVNAQAAAQVVQPTTTSFANVQQVSNNIQPVQEPVTSNSIEQITTSQNLQQTFVNQPVPNIQTQVQVQPETVANMTLGSPAQADQNAQAVPQQVINQGPVVCDDIRIDTDTLRTMLISVDNAFEPREDNLVSAVVILNFNEDGLLFKVTDGESYMEQTNKVYSYIKPESLCLGRKFLLSLVKLIDSEVIVFERDAQNPKTIILKAIDVTEQGADLSAEYRLAEAEDPHENVPIVIERPDIIDNANYIPISDASWELLISNIKCCSPFTAIDDSLAMLAGIYFDGNITMSTNNSTLSICEPIPELANEVVYIPVRVAKKLTLIPFGKNIEMSFYKDFIETEPNGTDKYRLFNSRIIIKCDNINLVMPLMEDEYYEKVKVLADNQVLPLKQNALSFEDSYNINSSALTKAIDRASIFIRDVDKGVAFVQTIPGKLVITSKDNAAKEYISLPSCLKQSSQYNLEVKNLKTASSNISGNELTFSLDSSDSKAVTLKTDNSLIIFGNSEQV